MDFNQLVRTRRSIRAFEAADISTETLARLLEAARWAPSAGNLQPWHFVVVKNKNIRESLVKEAYGLSWLSQAPVLIVVCALSEISAGRYGERGKNLYCLQDTAAAVQNILLAAKNEGLGSCWVGAFDEKACATILGLSDNMRPVVMIPLGIPAQEGSGAKRKPLAEITDYLL